MESDELLLARVEVFLAQDAISDYQDVLALGRFDTPLLVWLVRAEISDDLHVFEGVVIEDDEAGDFGGQFDEEALGISGVENGFSGIKILQLFQLFLSEGLLIDSNVLEGIFIEIDLESSPHLGHHHDVLLTNRRRGVADAFEIPSHFHAELFFVQIQNAGESAQFIGPGSISVAVASGFGCNFVDFVLADNIKGNPTAPVLAAVDSAVGSFLAEIHIGHALFDAAHADQIETIVVDTQNSRNVSLPEGWLEVERFDLLDAGDEVVALLCFVWQGVLQV